MSIVKVGTLIISNLNSPFYLVPDRPPEEILAKSLGKDAVQLEWNPVLPKYANGEVLGYKIIYGVVNSILRANSIVPAPGHRLKIGGLKPNTNYSFQILAFTSKGSGVTSTSFFAKTSPGTLEIIVTNK